MIELIYSNKTENLLANLASHLELRRSEGVHPLEPVELVVPNRNMETWVRLGLAQANGVAANLRFRWLENLIGDIISKACPGKIKVVDLETTEAAVLAVLLDDQLICGSEDLQPVRRYMESRETGAPAYSSPAATSPVNDYIDADGTDIRRVQLAYRMASLFRDYSFSRPEMITAWREPGSGSKIFGPAGDLFADPAAVKPGFASTAAWQRALWLAVFGKGGILDNNPPPEGGSWITLDQLALNQKFFNEIGQTQLPPVHIFGVSYVARIFQLLFARLGEVSPLRIYTLNPCAEFWEDVETDREFFYRLDRELNRRSRRLWHSSGEPEDDDPFGLFEADNPALRYWGRPGREHIRLLGELTDCDFHSAFADPLSDGVGLLHHLQSDILMRQPEQTLVEGFFQTDETINLVAAPSIRREVEWVADEIWNLIRDNKNITGDCPLRFSDIAVIVNSTNRDLYLPQIETVFAACHNLPSSVSDLPGQAGSRVIEAMNLLLNLPFGRFSRAEMLNLMSHPAIISRFDQLTPNELSVKADTLGIIFGADHSDHRGTYIDEDVFNWDQGIKRLSLGAFMSGEQSGDTRIFETSRGRWLVEESPGTSATAAAQFGFLARSLLADARFIRTENMTLTRWAEFFRAQTDYYLCADESADAGDRLRIIRSLAKLETMDLGYEVSGRVAAEIAGQAIDSLGSSRGQYLADGVAVSSFLPMRAIPFKVVFVLGLGEGLFPAAWRRNALDLRSAKRRAGDVDPSERDRYMFLETLLSTREKLYISYVKRDEQTGEPLQPSAVVQELLHMLELGYLGKEGVKNLVTEPPLRRYDEPLVYERSFFDEAKMEARIQEIAWSWNSNFNPTGKTELVNIEHLVSPEAWSILRSMLSLPGKPPSVSPTLAEPETTPSGREFNAVKPVSVTFPAIRRFLECPMQGWASAMLGLSEMDEDLADREEEDFEVNRMIKATLLRDIFLDAAASGVNPDTLYDERAARLRLAGKIPVGILGRINRERHIAIMEGWQSLLEKQFPVTDGKKDQNSALHSLQRISFGYSGRLSSAYRTSDPLILNVTVNRGKDEEQLLPLRISGLTEGLIEMESATIILQPNKPPTGMGLSTVAGSFRYLLRGIVDYAALAAVDQTGKHEKKILICFSDDSGNNGILKLTLRPLEKEQARRWLSSIAEDLIGETHAYLMPCEAVFSEYYRRFKQLSEEEINLGINPDHLLDGSSVQDEIKRLAADSWAKFSSLWGPVPSPRSYSPPAPEIIKEIVLKRLGPILENITSLGDS